MILVTGGAGFIGSNFVLDWLETVGESVINVDVLSYAGNPDNLASLTGNPLHRLVQGDVRDQALLSRLLAEHRPRAVVHFAAESHVDRSIHGPAAFLRANVDGTFRLLESTRLYWSTLPPAEQQAFRFLHVSTDEVYGSLAVDDEPFRETSPYAPNSPYAASKAASDHLVRAWHHTYSLPVLTTNCSNNYGPYQFPEKLVPLMVTRALAGEPLPVYGDGRQIRDWLYVRDHCAALRVVLRSGQVGRSYNIGGSAERTNLDLVHQLCELLDELRPDPHGPYARLIRHVTDRPGHDRRYAIDADRIRSELQWAPAESLDSGLRKTVLWYLAHQGWVARVRNGSYRDWVDTHDAELAAV